MRLEETVEERRDESNKSEGVRERRGKYGGKCCNRTRSKPENQR